MKTNATERNAIASRVIKNLKADLKVANAKFKRSKECKTIFNLEGQIKALEKKLQNMRDSLQIEVDVINKSNGRGEHIRLSHGNRWNGSEYVNTLEIELDNEWQLKQNIEEEICILQLDADGVDELIKKLSEVFKV
tara:strand:+ start:202 stop:609 length:408 start_codon:yes stop_codon:yes gene_type:complete